MSNNYTPPADVAATIDSMVAAAGARVEHSNRLTSADGTRSPNVKINHDGSATITGAVHEAARIPDSNRDLDASRANNAERVAGLQARLDEVRFDQRTGERIPLVQGRARELLDMELVTARNAAAFDDMQFQKLEAQRARDAQWKAAEAEERLTRLRITGGNPQDEARLDALLKEEELRLVAKAIMAKRFEAGRG